MMYFQGKVIAPAALVQISRIKPEEKDGKATALSTTVTLRGTLVSWKGSPQSDGSWWTTSSDPPDEVLDPEENHAAILRKQAALRSLLQQQNQILELQPWDGSAPTKFVVRLRELTFPEDIWYDRCAYTAVFDADEQGFTNTGAESVSETWTVEPLNDDLGNYRVQHVVSVKGKTQRDATGATTKPAWEAARDYILETVGLGFSSERAAASGVLNQFSLTGYNHVRRQTIDESEGTCQVSEDWVAHSDSAIHEQTLTRRYDPNGLQNVSVEGTVTGLRTSDSSMAVTQTKFQAMEQKWAAVQPTLYAAATGVAGEVLNTAPLGVRIQTNPAAGVLSYQYEYNSRATSYANARSELVSVSDSAAPDAYALIPIPGRAAGPLPQALGTKANLRVRTLNIEVEMPAASIAGSYSAPDTDAYVLSQTPSATYVFIDQDEISFSPTSGRYSRVTRWSYS